MGYLASYVRNLASIATGREPERPLIFSYYVTHRCGLNCRYCCDGDGRRFKENPIRELDADEARRLIRVLRRSGDTLDITGGEPMVREDLEDILEAARSAGFRVVLNTKGVGIEDRRRVLDLTDVLVISVDTMEPETLSRVIGRPREVAERVYEALRFAVAERRASGTKVVLSAVATPGNSEQVAGVLEYAMAKGLGFHVSPEIVGTTVNPALRGNEAYARLMARVIDAKRRSRGVLGVMPYLKGIRDFSRFTCHPLLMPTIRPDGCLYYPCLESSRADVNVLEAGGYPRALAEARSRHGPLADCTDCCHVFCHMALSLVQQHPIAALGELRDWRT
ncbi:MAG: radical SAM protein [Planctomycetota bacterium]|jgi:MoaA/NifB/PqqE/SkfB family radical SAM enzyme